MSAKADNTLIVSSEGNNSETSPEQREMHAMMARVCKVDLDTATKEAKINLYRVCALFQKKGHTAADVKTFGLWWYQEHWIGKQQKAPTLKQVQDTWMQAFEKGMPLEDEAERYVDPFERMLREKSEELRRRREMAAQPDKRRTTRHSANGPGANISTSELEDINSYEGVA